MMKQVFLLFITKYAYIASHTFFINLKLLLNYREIDIRSAEANTIKELITTLPAFQKFMIFLFSPLRSSSYFYLLVQPWITSWLTISIIDASNSYFIVLDHFFFAAFLAALRSYKLRKVLSSLLLNHSKDVKHMPWKRVIATFN